MCKKAIRPAASVTRPPPLPTERPSSLAPTPVLPISHSVRTLAVRPDAPSNTPLSVRTGDRRAKSALGYDSDDEEDVDDALRQHDMPPALDYPSSMARPPGPRPSSPAFVPNPYGWEDATDSPRNSISGYDPSVSDARPIGRPAALTPVHAHDFEERKDGKSGRPEPVPVRFTQAPIGRQLPEVAEHAETDNDADQPTGAAERFDATERPIKDATRAGFEYEGVGEAKLVYKNAPQNPKLKISKLNNPKLMTPARYRRSLLAACKSEEELQRVKQGLNRIRDRDEQVKRLPLHRTASFDQSLKEGRRAPGTPVAKGASLHVEIPTTMGAATLPLEAVTGAHPLTGDGMAHAAKSLHGLLAHGPSRFTDTVHINTLNPLTTGADPPAINPGAGETILDGDGGLSTGDPMVPGSYSITSTSTLYRRGLPKTGQTTLGVPIRSLFNDNHMTVHYLTETGTEEQLRLKKAIYMAKIMAEPHHLLNAKPEQKHALNYLMLQSVMNRMAIDHQARRGSGMVKSMFGLNLKGQTSASSVGLTDDHLFEIRRRAAALEDPQTIGRSARLENWEPSADGVTSPEDKKTMLAAMAQVGKPELSAQAAYEGGKEIPNFHDRETDELSTVVEARQPGALINKEAHALHSSAFGRQSSSASASRPNEDDISVLQGPAARFVKNIHAVTGRPKPTATKDGASSGKR